MLEGEKNDDDISFRRKKILKRTRVFSIVCAVLTSTVIASKSTIHRPKK